MVSDYVKVIDRGFLRLRNRAGAFIAGREFRDLLDEPAINVRGWVEIVARERGKKVPRLCRSGHNIWTSTGREYLALLMSIQTGPTTPFRSDHIAYVGVGTGTQVEDAGVTGLVTPAPYTTGQFLTAIDFVSTSFPLSPTRTAVKFFRLFAENEITIAPGSTVSISELGLFTNGEQSSFVEGGRLLTMAAAADQSPAAYKSVEPLDKNDALELELSWEIRF